MIIIQKGKDIYIYLYLKRKKFLYYFLNMNNL